MPNLNNWFSAFCCAKIFWDGDRSGKQVVVSFFILTIIQNSLLRTLNTNNEDDV